MPTFAEDFDSKFRTAQRRVSSQRDSKKPNGKPPTDAETDDKFISPDAAVGVSLEDFQAYMPLHAYIFTPSGELWPASSVNSRIPPQPVVNANGRPILKEDGKPMTIKANRWLDQNKPVEQMTWAPGREKL
jgi:hypothetical protein